MNKEQWLIFYSGDLKEIEDVENMANQIPQIELVVIEGSPILAGRVLTPFIDNNEGEHYYGLPSITSYANKLRSSLPSSK